MGGRLSITGLGITGELALRWTAAGFLEAARPCTDPDQRSSAHHPADQEGSILLMSTGSNSKLSSGHRR